MVEHIHEDAHLAGGLISQLRDSEELAHAPARRGRRRTSAAGSTTCSPAPSRAASSPPDARVTPLFHDLAGSLIFSRAVITAEPLDGAFLEELVDHVLLPVLPLLPKDN